ncbi:MAG: ATP-grasp domain-containing protein [Phycisphaerae bacterium]|jgi:D-alanine-D-alanine ligase
MNILIIHNDYASHAFAESNAGLKEEVNAVCKALVELKIKYTIKSIKKIEQLPKILAANKQKIVFNLVEELPADIKHACLVPAICRGFGRKFTGSDTPALLLAQNKGQTKAILKAAGVPAPDGAMVEVGQKISVKNLTKGYYIVKPAFSDASEGITADSIVSLGSKKMSAVIEKIHKQFRQPAIVEQFIPNRELNVSVLQCGRKIKVMPIAEIDFGAFKKGKPKIVDYAAKWYADSFEYNNTPRILPAKLPAKVAALVMQYAIGAFNALGCKDYVRVDFRLDEKNHPFVIEVNPNPDISPDAGFAAAIEAGGINYKKFVETLLKNPEL